MLKGVTSASLIVVIVVAAAVGAASEGYWETMYRRSQSLWGLDSRRQWLP